MIADQLTLGQWLKAARERLGFTLRQVEEITAGKVSNAYLSQIETGKISNISAAMLHRLCAALALDYGEALERAGDRQAPPAPVVCPLCGKAE